jgi:hypothetical protein
MRCAHGDYGYLFRCPHGCGQTPTERYEENDRNINYFLKRFQKGSRNG